MTAPVVIAAGDVVHYTPTPVDIDTGIPADCRDALVMACNWPFLALLVDAGGGETAQLLSPGPALMPGCWHHPGSWWRR